jgi:hypothetical protein
MGIDPIFRAGALIFQEGRGEERRRNGEPAGTGGLLCQ